MYFSKWTLGLLIFLLINFSACGDYEYPSSEKPSALFPAPIEAINSSPEITPIVSPTNEIGTTPISSPTPRPSQGGDNSNAEITNIIAGEHEFNDRTESYEVSLVVNSKTIIISPSDIE